MPIYEYRCESCGYQKEHLQKMSDAPLSTCPSCGKESYTKLLSAAGFQLKGSGWYATDFKNGGGKSASSSSASSSSDSAPAAGCGGGCACHPS
ncbi:zinc ribbon domain-containing protein [Azoarcus indigens]|uniref:Putative FmdB family regulatory protein n=1 Tax=Azoarcus indigens TaxID=29545 RepID=A0A4R6E9Z2_9RHOO|nr:zinc ribbon domain-containing protein [Azoarcus indigens]NMG63867.1 zinc ribbon domain-containing protein [Azoarcus indigens]TDN53858.1 putative FmdB family regulatory protein [Azoarcus indigens]